MNKFIRTGCAVTLLLAAGAGRAAEPAVELAWAALKGHAAQAQRYVTGERITRVYGQPLAFGVSPDAAAEQFRLRHAAVFGVDAVDLTAEGFDAAIGPVQPLLFDPDNGTYRFYLVRYTQQKDGIPVFRADLRLLTRNEPDFPVVLAASALRPLGAFIPDRGLLAPAFDPAHHLDRTWERFSTPEPVIWAGVNDAPAAPRLAYAVIAEIGVPQAGDHQRWLFVLDAENGQVLFSEDQIVRTDVTGNVNGLATTGPKADSCAPEASTPMPYAKVTITGGNTAYAGVDGDFVISHGGSDPVTVQSFMKGSFFYVDNVQGPEETLSTIVTPPGPANFTHNAPNNSEYVRAQVNGYVQANVVRDYCLTYNPTYPTISAQTDFPVYINRTDVLCPGNAWYDGSSLNFCASGQGFPNTAWSGIVHHEYGHHMVATGGSGQGQYGEGMGDCIAVLIADDPVVGYGILGDCDTGGRSADNTVQYPCDGEPHDCAELLSGCIWSTRNELKATHPADYLQILSNLTVNSILLHTGDQITPQITIDFLTLDDDDGNIHDGTPHCAEITAGFGAHNMGAATGILRVTPTDGLNSSGPVGGPFTPSSQIYTLENFGTANLDYLVTKTQPWVSLDNTSGTLGGGATTTVVVSINSNANNLRPGIYNDTVAFTNISYNASTSRPVTLTVTPEANLRVLTFSSARSGTCGPIDWAFVTGNAFASARSALLDPANYGPQGVVPRAIEFSEPCNEITAARLHGADLVLVSKITPDAPGSMTPLEIALLHDFVASGGGIFAFLNGAAENLAVIFGVTADGTGSGCASISNPSSPVVNGPFGVVSGCIAPNYHKLFSSMGPHGDEFLRSNGVAGASFTYQLGRAMLICDEEWCEDLTYDGCAVGTMNSMNARLFLNATAYVAPWPGFTYVPLGDMNCDGRVDFADIDPFVLALTDPAAYQATFPNCNILRGDCNGDGQVDFADIDPFVALLTG